MKKPVPKSFPCSSTARTLTTDLRDRSKMSFTSRLTESADCCCAAAKLAVRRKASAKKPLCIAETARSGARFGSEAQRRLITHRRAVEHITWSRGTSVSVRSWVRHPKRFRGERARCDRLRETPVGVFIVCGHCCRSSLLRRRDIRRRVRIRIAHDVDRQDTCTDENCRGRDPIRSQRGHAQVEHEIMRALQRDAPERLLEKF